MKQRGSSLCCAPWTSLHFDPHGWVTACTANTRDALGQVGRDRLVDIWAGGRARAFRAEFGADQLAEGCDVCRWQRASGGPDTMYARLYDDHRAEARAEGPVHVEFALSNRCNLACQMCHGGLSSSIRRQREGLPALPPAYGDAFFDELAPFLPGLHQAKFLGGEPFLARENHRIWTMMADAPRAPAVHVTTNGTIWNDHVEAILARLPMSFAVSVDGATATTVERIRRGADHAAILANLDRFQAHADANGTDVSLTYCLMRDNWSELPAFLCFAEERGLSAYVNTVLTPFRMSLYHLAPSALSDVVRSLDRHTEHLSDVLDRNLPVWFDQLARLRASAENTPLERTTPVHFPALRTGSDSRQPERRDETGGASAPSEAMCRRELRTWSAVEPTRLALDGSGTITTIDPGDLVSHHIERLEGAGVDELFVWLASAFGRPDTSESRVRRPDAGDRLLRFEGAERSTEVRVLSGRTATGAWWLLAVR